MTALSRSALSIYTIDSYYDSTDNKTPIKKELDTSKFISIDPARIASFMLEITPNYITFKNGTTVDYYSATDLAYEISLSASTYLAVCGVYVDTDYNKIRQEDFYQPPETQHRALYDKGDVVQ